MRIKYDGRGVDWLLLALTAVVPTSDGYPATWRLVEEIAINARSRVEGSWIEALSVGQILPAVPGSTVIVYRLRQEEL